MSRTIRANCMLLLTAFIWGCAFVAQRTGMEFVGPFTFNGIRCMIGPLVLIPVIYLIPKMEEARQGREQGIEQEVIRHKNKDLILGGIACGLCLFAGSTLQQFGLVDTTASKAGFITALYIVIVPIIGIFIGKKSKWYMWICILIATLGMYLLCVKENMSINIGDVFLFISAFLFASHIIVVDYFSRKADGVKLSCIQFFTCGIVSLICMACFETVNIMDIKACIIPILYAGVLSCGVAYTLQVVAQKDTTPTVASLIMSLESVFAAIAGVILLKEYMTMREVIGCIIMFVAIILAQLDDSLWERIVRKEKRKN